MNPTHYFIKEDGDVELVFPQGHTQELALLPTDYWDRPRKWNKVTQEFDTDIACEQERLWNLVKAKREAMHYGGAPTAKGWVDTHEQAKQNISGAVQLATIAKSLGQPFLQQWTMANNLRLPLNADEMIMLGVAVGQHVSRVYDVAAQLRDQIYAEGTTCEDLDLIDIEGAAWHDIP